MPNSLGTLICLAALLISYLLVRLGIWLRDHTPDEPFNWRIFVSFHWYLNWVDHR